MRRLATLLVLVLVLVLAPAAAAQPVQYRSAGGVEYRALADTTLIVRAQGEVSAQPRSVDRLLELGIAQGAARRFQDAINTFTRGLALAPDDARLYRWRGHRYISARLYDLAVEDLERAARLDGSMYETLYHLGVARYLKGEFPAAVKAFTRALRMTPNGGELAGTVDWLWMSLMRAGRTREADFLLASRTDSLPTTVAYKRRLAVYRGELAPARIFAISDTSDVSIATLAYGVGNWYLVRGDTTRARHWFGRAIASGGWPAFGFMAAEADLRRLDR